jgi:uncharacterized protein (TIGR02594 family)
MTDPRKPIFAAVRKAKPDVFNHPVDGAMRIGALDSVLDAIGIPRAGQVAKPSPQPSAHPTKEPRWMIEARARIGEKEIPGPRHNRWIAEGWKRLGAGWFTDDETPWCGLFVAHCIEAAGLPFPKMFPRAKAWADWGQPCSPTVGAVVVFGRQGGGHVGFLVGENALNYYVLGGNQSNAVNITPIAKSRMLAIRWPDGVAKPHPGLPPMSGGTVSVNEA